MDNITTVFQYLAQSNTINFILMIAILAFVVSKMNIGASFDKSVEDVSNSIKKSDEVKQNSQDLFDIAEAQMEKLPIELSRIEEESKEKARNLREQIEKSTKKTVENISKNASKVLSIEEKKISSDIMEETIKTSVQAATNNIINMLKSNPDLHKKFIEESLDELDRVKL